MAIIQSIQLAKELKMHGISESLERRIAEFANNPGDPQSDGWGSSIYLDSGYDGYYYSNYVRVRAGRKFQLMSGDDSGPLGESSEATPSWNNNIDFTLGTGDTATTFVEAATGVHPQTGESYYNALRINRGLPKYSSGSDDTTTNRYGQFHSKISSFNSSSTGWDAGASPPMVAGLNNVDSNHERFENTKGNRT